MKKLIIHLAILSGLLSSSSVFALSAEAEQGKAQYQVCHACHNPELNPALGPPMWGVTKRYKKATGSKDEFVNRMVDFVLKPDMSKVLAGQAVKNLGLMPAMNLPEPMLRNIATYLFEEKFAPPCTHWKHAIANGKLKGDNDHTKKDMKMYKKFCQ